MLLGQVGEAEVDGERPQHCCLALEREGAYLSLESCPEPGPARPRLARGPDPLDRVEELSEPSCSTSTSPSVSPRSRTSRRSVREHDRVSTTFDPSAACRRFSRPYRPIGMASPLRGDNRSCGEVGEVTDW